MYTFLQSIPSNYSFNIFLLLEGIKECAKVKPSSID